MPAGLSERGALVGGTEVSRECDFRFAYHARVHIISSRRRPAGHSLVLQGSPPSGKRLIPFEGEMAEWLKAHAWKAPSGSSAAVCEKCF